MSTVADVDNQPVIFTTSFSGLRAAVTRQGIWSGFAWGATDGRIAWDESQNVWQVGSSTLSFGRTFRLFSHSGEPGEIVYARDATGMGP